MDTKKSASEILASLTLGLWTVAIIGYVRSGIDWSSITLFIIGLFTALCAGYFFFPLNWKKESALNLIQGHSILKVAKALGWLIRLLVFGVALVLTKIILFFNIGIIIMIIAFVIFYISMWRINKTQTAQH